MSAALEAPGVALDADALIGLEFLALRHRGRDRRLSSLPGGFATRRRGQGLELADIRAYQPGDDVRHLDRSATARTGRPHVRTFQQERDRLTLLDSGQIWLSERPDVPGSISWGHPFPRTLAWGLFETRDGRRFRLYDTHFPYRPEDDGARTKAARLIADRIAADDGLPAILTGDFNAGAGSDAHAVLARQLYDVWQFAPQIDGPTPDHHGFLGGTPTRRIDWILLRGFAVTQARAIGTHRDGRYPSDHYPIMADLRWID